MKDAADDFICFTFSIWITILDFLELIITLPIFDYILDNVLYWEPKKNHQSFFLFSVPSHVLQITLKMNTVVAGSIFIGVYTVPISRDQPFHS